MGGFRYRSKIAIRLIIGLIVLSADLSSWPVSMPAVATPTRSARFLRVPWRARCAFLRKRIASCVPRFMRLAKLGPVNRRPIFQESRDERVVVP